MLQRKDGSFTTEPKIEGYKGLDESKMGMRCRGTQTFDMTIEELTELHERKDKRARWHLHEDEDDETIDDEEEDGDD